MARNVSKFKNPLLLTLSWERGAGPRVKLNELTAQSVLSCDRTPLQREFCHPTRDLRWDLSYIL